MQGQDVHARAEAQAAGALGDRGQKNVLRWGEAVNGRGVVLRQVVGVKAGGVEALDLDQTLTIDPIEPEARHRLDVIEDPEAQRHASLPRVPNSARGGWSRGPRSTTSRRGVSDRRGRVQRARSWCQSTRRGGGGDAPRQRRVRKGGRRSYGR